METSKVTKMMISDLPRDLVSEILSRVPLKSMKEVRLTCTTWNTLTKSESFAKTHIRKGAASKREGEYQMIVRRDDNSLYLASVFVNDPSIEFIGTLSCCNEQVKISQVFHCEGLLLCVLKEDHSKVVVWNPYWGQTRSIECRFSNRRKGYDRFSYALGYEDKKSCPSHKFLRFIDNNSFAPPQLQFFWYEIYDFDSGLWKTLDVTPYWRIQFNSQGVSLGGNTYWLGSERKTSQDSHVICFDFISESFGPILRLPFDVQGAGYVMLSCVREEKLVVLFNDNKIPKEIDIWITTKIEVGNVSWSKFLTLNTDLEHWFPYGNFFIDEEKKVVMGIYRKTWDNYALNIIGEGGYSQLLDLGEDGNNISWKVNVCCYVPSLVQIKQSAGGKEKQQSDLEKRLFDENMSRLAAVEERCAAVEERIRLRRVARTKIGTGRNRV